MLQVDILVTQGHPPEQIIAGSISLSNGTMNYRARGREFETLMQNIMRDPIVGQGGKLINPDDKENWLANLQYEYKSYRLQATAPRQVLHFDWREEDHPREPAGGPTGGQFTAGRGGSEGDQYITEGSQGVFSPVETVAREQARKLLSDVGQNWMHNRTGGAEPTRKDLADMMTFLGQKYSDQVNYLIKDFDSYSKYPDRPAVHLIVGEKGVPDVWLLGWRENEKGLEATPIHDHGPSEAGVYVHKGAVNERIFAIDKAEIGQNQIEFREVDRGLNQGSAITINAPYLHDIGAQKGAGTSVTIHAYYPPLNDMNFYEVSGKKLIKTGSWKENPEVMKAKGFRLTFPCFHYSKRKYHDPREARFIRAYDWQESDHPRADDGKFTDAGGSDKAALQKHLVDYKADRELEGADAKPISDVIPGAKRVGYLDVPGIEHMHRLMGVPQPSLKTDANEYGEARNRLFENQPLTQVPMSQLTFTQPRINKERAADLAHIPEQLSKPVSVVKSGGGYYLMNGHHRVAAQHVAGMKSVPANVLDLDSKKFHRASYYSRELYEWDESKHPRVPGGQAEGGQFTSGEPGGNGSAEARNKQLDSHDTQGLEKLARQVETEFGMAAHFRDLEARLKAGTQTKALNSINGQYTPERIARHEEIVNGYLSEATPVDNPTLTIMGGVSGSGKSSAVKTLGLSNLVHVDADEVRAQLPEYRGWNAALTQDETDDIVAELVGKAVRERKNILYDGTLKSYDKFKRIIENFKTLGYKIDINYVDAPMDKAMRNVVSRYQQTGRFVNLNYVASQDHQNKTSFEKLKPLADNWKMFDTSGPSARLVSKS